MNEASKNPGFRQPDLTLQINLATPTSEAKAQTAVPRSTSGNELGLELAASDRNVEVLGQFFRFEVYAVQPFTDEHRLNVQDWLIPAIPPLLELLLSHLSLNLDILERICLVEPEILGEVIFQVQREKGLKPVYTGQDGYYHTAGKTISYATDGGRVKSTVICNLDIFGATIEALRKGEPYSEWTVEEQLSYYVTAHEIGHALDHWTRSEVSMDEAVSIGKEENWERISAHYAPMLFNEYLACVVAAGSVTTRLQSDMLKNWQTDCKEFTDILNRKRAAFVSDWKEVAGCFWILLLQLAKLLGHERSECGFPIIVFKETDWEEAKPKETRRVIVKGMGETLVAIKANYPNLPSEGEIVARLTPYFLSLAASYGYFFREEDLPSDSGGE